MFQRHERVISAFAISRNASAQSGYASGSSIMNEAYASAGPATAPTAANSAHGRERIMRPSR